MAKGMKIGAPDYDPTYDAESIVRAHELLNHPKKGPLIRKHLKKMQASVNKVVQSPLLMGMGKGKQPAEPDADDMQQ